MSNHMAKRVNRLALMNENMAARAFIGGMCPNYQDQKSLIKRIIVEY